MESVVKLNFFSYTLTMKCFNSAKKIVQTLQNSGFIAYFAGGWVRDYLLGKDPYDIDIATTATPDEIMNLFPKTIPVGINFSILIVVQDDEQHEVATFRAEEEHLDGRRPSKILHVSPEEDAKRRDFTINGMFYDPLTDTVYDYVGGKDDLKKGIIRAVGNPHIRFKEDRLRMIRACRYSARFFFPIEENTFQAILSHASELFPAVAIERVYDEFNKMTKDPHLFDALLLMHKCNLLEVIFKNLPLISYEKLYKKLHNLPKFPKNTYPSLYMYELFEKLSLEQKLNLCLNFKVSKAEMNFTQELNKWDNSMEYTDYQLAKLYANPLADRHLEIASIYKNDSAFATFHKKKQHLLSSHVKRLQANTLLVTAADLIALGMEKGKGLGNALQKAEELCINHNCSSKEEVIALLNLLQNP